MKVLNSLLFLCLATSAFAAESIPVILKDGDNTVTVTLDSQVTERREYCSPSSDGGGAQDCSYYDAVLYYTAADIELSILPSAFDESLKGQKITLGLNGEKAYVISSTSDKLFFEFEEKIINTRNIRGTKLLTTKIILTPKLVADATLATAMSNLKVENKTLTFETAVQNDIEAATTLNIKKKNIFGYFGSYFERIETAVTPHAGGFLHTYDLRETGRSLNGKYEFNLSRWVKKKSSLKAKTELSLRIAL